MVTHLDAPIEPGKGAAGYRIGQTVDTTSKGSVAFSPEQVHDVYGRPTGIWILRSESVDLWTDREGVVQQIGVHGEYRGKALDCFGLGSTIDDIERQIGPCTEDDEDNLVISGVPGQCFEIASQSHGGVIEHDIHSSTLRSSPITWIVVFEKSEHPDDECEAHPENVSQSTT